MVEITAAAAPAITTAASTVEGAATMAATAPPMAELAAVPAKIATEAGTATTTLQEIEGVAVSPEAAQAATVIDVRVKQGSEVPEETMKDLVAQSGIKDKDSGTPNEKKLNDEENKTQLEQQEKEMAEQRERTRLTQKLALLKQEQVYLQQIIDANTMQALNAPDTGIINAPATFAATKRLAQVNAEVTQLTGQLLGPLAAAGEVVNQVATGVHAAVEPAIQQEERLFFTTIAKSGPGDSTAKTVITVNAISWGNCMGILYQTIYLPTDGGILHLS